MSATALGMNVSGMILIKNLHTPSTFSFLTRPICRSKKSIMMPYMLAGTGSAMVFDKNSLKTVTAAIIIIPKTVFKYITPYS